MRLTFRRAGWMFLLFLLASFAPFAFVDGEAGLEQTRRLLQLTLQLAALTFVVDGLAHVGGRAWAWWKNRKCTSPPARRPPRPSEDWRAKEGPE